MTTIYTGTFTVTNNTGGTITNVVAQHSTTDYGTTVFRADSMGQGIPGGQTSLKTSNSNKDRWSVSFINAAGQLRTGHENCGFESEDNGGNVQIVLTAEMWDIIMPVSSACDDIDYDQT